MNLVINVPNCMCVHTKTSAYWAFEKQNCLVLIVICLVFIYKEVMLQKINISLKVLSQVLFVRHT